MPQTSAPPPARRWLALATVGLAQLMIVLDATVVNIALPAAQADLGFSVGDRQWIITAYSLAFGSLLLLGGRLSDLMGRRRTFVIGLVGFAAASALGGAATSFGMLVGARALQGAFGALLAPTALALLTTTFTVSKERARAFGVFGAIAGAGGAIGLLLGGVLTQTLDWRWNLYINVVIAAIAVVGTVMFVDDAVRTGPRPRLDVPGTALVSAALFLLVYGFSNIESEGWGSPLSWGALATACVLLVGFVVRQRRARHPLLPLAILLDRNRGAAYASILIAGSGMFGVFLFVTFYLQTTLGFTPIQTGLSFLPMVAMLVLAAQIGTNLALPRLGPKVMVPTGMALATVGMLYLTRLGVDSTYTADVLPALALVGLGMGTIMPASMQTATLGVEPAFAGVASALVNTAQQVGGSIGTAVLNTLAATAATAYLASHVPATDAVLAQAAVHSYATAYWWGAGFFAVGGVLAALLFRRRVTEEPTVPAAGVAEPAIA
ncbi:MFS transporter [Pseudonocardia humida]|uniref:MFS transporter n=1 Tax=Pseudonocardia humida TaxID=2800819 RepID=UPI00207D23C5|nr:MFS transporter [Pseudonocardia humida]